MGSSRARLVPTTAGMEAPTRELGNVGRPRPGFGPPPAGRRDPLLTTASLGFAVCAAIAIGYGLWALYGSGSELASLDVPGAGRGSSAVLGPIALEPRMNPLRAVLRAAHAPVGSARIRYEIELVDASGRPSWERKGSIGSHDDEASIVWTTTSLALFDVATAGEHFVRVRFADRGMDDLREAKVELRRNVTQVDARIPWSFGLASFACLIASVVLSHRRPWPHRPLENAPRAAA
jgi:hypothetical protein